MAWIPIAAWIAAAVIAVLVLGFCAWELIGKARRLQRDVAGLQTLNAELGALSAELTAASARFAAAGDRRP